MFRKSWFLLLGLAAGTTLLAAGGSAIVIDSFNDGDSEGWLENDFTGGRGSFDASSGSYVLETTEPIPIDDPSVGTLDADWEPSEGAPIFANGTMRGLIRANTYGTTIGFLFRESHETETDYGFYGSTSFGTFYIERFNLLENPAAPQTIIAMADPDDFPFEVGETYVLEATVVGHKLELKAWKLGDEEPEEPILSVQDKDFKAPENTGLGAIAFFDPVPLALQGVDEVVVSATVDDLTFIPGWD
jgi:hypothetical protein